MSLTTCLKRAGAALDPDDRLAILSRASELRAAGRSTRDAGIEAVSERLEVVKAMLKAIPAAEQPAQAADERADDAIRSAMQSAMSKAGWTAEVGGPGNTIWTKRRRGERYTANLLEQQAGRPLRMEVTVLAEGGVDVGIGEFDVTDANDAAAAADRAIANSEAESGSAGDTVAALLPSGTNVATIAKLRRGDGQEFLARVVRWPGRNLGPYGLALYIGSRKVWSAPFPRVGPETTKDDLVAGFVDYLNTDATSNKEKYKVASEAEAAKSARQPAGGAESAELTTFELSQDGIIGRELSWQDVPNGSAAFQYALGAPEEGRAPAIYRRRADERGSYGGWRWEAKAPAPPRAAQNAAAPAKRPAGGAVESFGEELPPARRNLAAKLDEDLKDEDIVKRPLSELWPLAENEAIEDTFVAAVAHAARAEIPAKPRQSYKLRRWVEAVKMLRGLAGHVVGARLTPETLADAVATKYASLKDWHSKIVLLQLLPRDQWKRIGAVEPRPEAFTYDDDGKRVVTPMLRVTVDGRSHWLSGDGTVEGSIDAIRKLLGDAEPEKRMQFEVRGSGARAYKINKKGDPEYRALMTFATAKEALAAIENDYDGLVAAWEQVKARDNVTERDVRSAENRPRAGKDHRGGKDVTPEKFQEQFGFRGGEFGKWVKQGAGDKERQAMLNSAYDALMDLAEIVGIPPRAISLDGTLGIAFGSRGSGWASAHFEPSNLVINLTKTRGAGVLAHEWFHALDNYFSRLRRDGAEAPFTGDQTAYRTQNFITHKPEALMVRKDGSRRFAPMTRGKLEALHEARKHLTDEYNPEKWKSQDEQSVRPEVEQRFVALVQALKDSPMARRAALLDKGGGYWSRTLELAARAFENFVQARMMEQGYHNDFLANVVPVERFARDHGRYPYLLAGEIKPIAEAFDALFGEIKTRETPSGMALYEPGPQEYSSNYETDLFGDPLPAAPARRPSRGARRQAAEADGNVDAVAEVRDTEAPYGEFYTRTILGVDRRIRVPFDRVTTAAQAAASFAHLADSAVERFDALVTDKDGRPLAFVGGFKGALAQTSIYPGTIVAEAVRVPGAANLWLGHNHPSGKTTLSLADSRLSQVIADVFEGSGIEVRGILATNSALKYSFEPRGGRPEISGTAEDGNANLSVPSIERRLGQRISGKPIGSPSDAKDAAETMYGQGSRSGILMLNAQYEPVAWVPLPDGMRGKLKGTGGLHAIYRAISESNAGAALIIHGGELSEKLENGETSARNIAAALRQIDVNTLDIINAKTRESMAEIGDRLHASAVFSRASDAGADIAAAWKMLAENDDLFSFPKVDSIDPVEIAGKATPDLGIEEAPEWPSDIARAWYVYPPGKAKTTENRGFIIHYKDGPVEINVAKFKEGDAGSQVYAVAGAYAHNVGATFAGDRMGITEVGVQRRLENMISLALKFGTTDFLSPHPDMLKSLGFEWTPGDSDANLQAMLVASYENAVAKFPALKDVVYDPDTGKLKSLSLGVELDVRDRANLIAGARGSGIPIGRRTLSRLGVTQAVIESYAGAQRGQLLGVIGKWARGSLESPGVLKRALYSRKSQASRGQRVLDTSPEAEKATAALNNALVRYGLGAEWKNAYEAVALPDALSGIREAFQVAFGRDVRAVAPTADRFNIFNGVYLPSQPKTVYVNADADIGFVQIAGHELWHDIERTRPDLIEWYRSVAQAYYKNIPKYQAKLNALLQPGETPYTADKALAELEADFLGDSLADHEFLQALADASPTKFRAFLLRVRAWLGKVARLLRGHGSSEYVTDVKALQAYLRDVMVAFAEGKPVPAGGAAVAFSRRETPTWYSELARQVQAASMKTAPAAMWKSWLKGLTQKGVKPDEIEWSGLPEWLDMQEGKVTREAVSEYLRANGVQVSETVLGTAGDRRLKAAGGMPLFNRAAADDGAAPARQAFSAFMSAATERSTSRFNVLHRSLSTQLHKAWVDRDFALAFGHAQNYEHDIARASARPAELAPDLLPAFDNARSAWARLVHGDRDAERVRKVGAALWAGTLENGPSPVDGRVWTDDELRERFDLDDTQVALYRQAREAIDASLDETASALAFQMIKKYAPHLRGAMRQAPGDAREIIEAAADEITAAGEGAQEALADALAVLDRADALKDGGYAPLMRFGRYAVSVTDADGNLLHFEKFDNELQAKTAAMKLRRAHPDATIERSTMSEQDYKLFAGVDPESVALFADQLAGTIDDDALQAWYRNAVSERSALKRMIGPRKGMPGFSSDLRRVLASFITSNARLAARQLNMGEMMGAIDDMRKRRVAGDVIDEAVKLKEYLDNPDEPFKGLRSLMFTWYLGGSVAAAAVNATQPIMMTLPYLSQFGPAAKHLGSAVREAMSGQVQDEELSQALHRAAEDGKVDPQEVHHLYHEGMTSLIDKLPGGSNIKARAQGAATLWGMMFGAVENFNRRLTFIAAYRMATADTNLGDPYSFAVRAVDETQGQYGKANRPNWARGTGSFGAVGVAAFTFKQFSIAYVELLVRMAKSGPRGKAAALSMLGLLMLASGLQGMPGADDLEDLIDTASQRLGYRGNSRATLRETLHDALGETLGDMVMYGAGDALPIDIQSRLGLGNLLPSTGLLTPSNRDRKGDQMLEILGPIGGWMRGVVDAADTGVGDSALAIFAPLAVKNALVGIQMGANGQYSDMRGRKVVETDALDAAVKAVGFQPTGVSRARRPERMVTQDITRVRQVESDIVALRAQAIVERDPDLRREADAMLSEWNDRNPELRIRVKDSQIVQRVRQMRRTSADRLLTTAPRETRRALADVLN